jgi:hypothetical protein
MGQGELVHGRKVDDVVEFVKPGWQEEGRDECSEEREAGEILRRDATDLKFQV